VEALLSCNKDMQIDASVSTNFKDTLLCFYGGVDFLGYDANYKEVRMNLDNGDEKKSKSEKRKKNQNVKTQSE
jgi:hypothetical protein